MTRISPALAGGKAVTGVHPGHRRTQEPGREFGERLGVAGGFKHPACRRGAGIIGVGTEQVAFGDVGAALSRLSPELLEVVQAMVFDGLTAREASNALRTWASETPSARKAAVSSGWPASWHSSAMATASARLASVVAGDASSATGLSASGAAEVTGSSVRG